MRPEESRREPGTFLGQIKKGIESGDFCHCLYKPICQNQHVGVEQPMGRGGIGGGAACGGRAARKGEEAW